MTPANELARDEPLSDESHGYQSGDALPIDPSRRRDLLSHARGATVAGIRQIVARALSQMSEEMSALAAKKTDEEEQRALFDAASVVDSSKSAVEANFAQSYDLIFDRQLGQTAGSQQADQSDQEWALVDDSYIRDKLRRERLVNRTKNRLDSDEVLGIRARFGALIGNDWFDETAHPAAPEFVYEALQKAIDGVGKAADVRMTLLQAFEPYVTANLNSVYAKVNAQLREQQVLPRIKPRVALTPDSVRNNANRGDQTEDGIENLKRATGASNEETFVLPPAGPARNSILQALANQVAEGGAQARSSAVRMLAEKRNFGANGGDETPPDGDLIEALDSLQSGSDAALGQDKQALHQLSEQARGNGSPLDQLTVEIVSLIFDFLYDDPRIPEAIKTQLLRLQVVAVKAALLDRSFFASRQHPMRRLIDRTSELSCDPDTDASDGSAFTHGIRDIVDVVLTEFDRDLGVFSDAVDRLAELESSENARRADELEELTASARQTEVHALATEQMRRELFSRLDEMTPAFVREFIQDWWLEVMVDACVKDGEQASAQYLEIAEQLIWSVVVARGTEIVRLAAVLPKMIAGLNSGLSRLATQQGQHDPFFNELMKWHTKTISDAKKRSDHHDGSHDKSGNVRMSADGQVEFAKLNEVEEPEPTPISGDAEIIDDLAKGHQLQLSEAQAEPMIVKLAWVSPARKLFALSRFPDFARSVSREEMIAMLASGRLVRVSTVATIDRAIKAVETVDADSNEPQTLSNTVLEPAT